MKSLYCTVLKKITTAQIQVPWGTYISIRAQNQWLRQEPGSTLCYNKAVYCDQCLRLYTSFTNLILHNLILLLKLKLWTARLISLEQKGWYKLFSGNEVPFHRTSFFFVCFQVLEN